MFEVFCFSLWKLFQRYVTQPVQMAEPASGRTSAPVRSDGLAVFAKPVSHNCLPELEINLLLLLFCSVDFDCGGDCLHGGRCVAQDTCQCAEGYIGDHCESGT